MEIVVALALGTACALHHQVRQSVMTKINQLPQIKIGRGPIVRNKGNMPSLGLNPRPLLLNFLSPHIITISQHLARDHPTQDKRLSLSLSRSLILWLGFSCTTCCVHTPTHACIGCCAHRHMHQLSLSYKLVLELNQGSDGLVQRGVCKGCARHLWDQVDLGVSIDWKEELRVGFPLQCARKKDLDKSGLEQQQHIEASGFLHELKQRSIKAFGKGEDGRPSKTELGITKANMRSTICLCIQKHQNFWEAKSAIHMVSH